MAEDVTITISGWSHQGQGVTIQCGRRLSGTMLATNNTSRDLTATASEVRISMIADGPVQRFTSGIRLPSRIPTPIAFDIDVPPGVVGGIATFTAFVYLGDSRQFVANYPVTIKCP
jgi:hypothetical protein